MYSRFPLFEVSLPLKPLNFPIRLNMFADMFIKMLRNKIVFRSKLFLGVECFYVLQFHKITEFSANVS